MPKKKEENYDEIYPDEEEPKISKSSDMAKLTESKPKDTFGEKKDTIINKLDTAINLLNRNPRNRKEVIRLVSESVKLIREL